MHVAYALYHNPQSSRRYQRRGLFSCIQLLFIILGNLPIVNYFLHTSCKLHLSDAAIAELMSSKLNGRLLSELIAHPDFAELLAALEVFVDHVVSENMEIINKVYRVSLDTITKKKIPEEQRDEYIAQLKEASIDPDDYLRFRLSRRFDKVVQGIYEANKKEALSDTGQGFIKNLVGQIDRFD